MGKDKVPELLQHAAKRASQNTFFLAADLLEFRRHRRMDETELASFLGCSCDLLSKLALCRRPDPDSKRFQMEVKRIAEVFSFEPTRLFQLVREVDALRTLKQARSGIGQDRSKGLLMAARDKESDGPVKRRSIPKKIKNEEEPT